MRTRNNSHEKGLRHLLVVRLIELLVAQTKMTKYSNLKIVINAPDPHRAEYRLSEFTEHSAHQACIVDFLIQALVYVCFWSVC